MSAVELFDMHCHLGFFPDAALPDALAGVAGFLNCTVTPAEYDATAPRFAAFPQVRTGMGLHPWYLDPDEGAALAQADALCERITAGCAVGEVGLDFGPRHADTGRVQAEAFRRIADRATQVGGCLLSVHSVQASQAVLDILEAADFFSRGIAIFHWYSGSSAHLARAIAAGARFSANPRMLATKRGREYLRIIPEGRLICETDFPAEDGSCPAPMASELERLVVGMAAIRNTDAEALANSLAINARALLCPQPL